MQSERFDHRHWLAQQIKQRKAKNPAFSLRAFARMVGLSPAHLSHLISGKRTLTEEVASQLARRLELPQQEQNFLGNNIGLKAAKNRRNPVFRELTAEHFQLISEWYYFAILGLAAISPNKASGKWIAARLNIGDATAAKALSLLLKLRYLKRRVGGGFELSTEPLMTQKDVPSEAVKKFHGQILDLAHRSLAKDTVDERYFGFRGIAFPQERLPQAKALARQFQDDLTKLAHEPRHEQSTTQHRVYALCVQFFPIDKGDSANAH